MKEVIKMSDSIIVALASLLGTGIGSYSGFKLMKYRIEQLEKKVEKHNNVLERTFVLEEKVNEQDHRISNIERKYNYGNSTQI
jgi:tetrahydromethanopterin S-methyltransferase subunit G